MDGEGVFLTFSDYEELIRSEFGNIETLSRRDYSRLFDPDFMRNAANNGEVFSFHFSGHADNVRKMQVFYNDPRRNKLIFREKSFNTTQVDRQRREIFNIFRLY